MHTLGETFDSPDAFSSKAKQQPDRDTDNGWRSVLVGNVVLEDVRYAYLKGKREAFKVSFAQSYFSSRVL